MTLQPAKGMRDLVGKEALIQEKVEEAFRKVFTSYGYIPLYTPAVESFELFKVKGASGDAIKEEIYFFKDKSDRELALRFEFTASLARIAATTQLKMPFKRYQIGEVYRYDRPQAGRYRAFYQADVDILGVEGLEAEVELMQVLRDCFFGLGLKPKVVFNSRKLLQALLLKYSPGKEIEAMRILDKMDKAGRKEVEAMLKGKGISTEIVEIIEKNSFAQIEKILGKENEGVVEARKFLEMCKEAGLDFLEFSAGLARGLEYYTGIVFEVKLENGPSVAGGGRYDKMVSIYGGKDTPAVGFGIGLSRVVDYLNETGFVPKLKGLFVCGVNLPPEKLMLIAQKIRKEGVAVEVDISGKSIPKAIEYAQKKGYEFVGIVGENELKTGMIAAKNLGNGKQDAFELNNLDKLKKFLEW